MSTKHEPKPAIKKAPGAGVHPFAKRAVTAQGRKPEPVPVPEVENPAEPATTADRSQFQVRLPNDLLRDLRVHSAVTERKLQDVTEQALREYLVRNS